jgi:hypothetical protein
LVSIALLFGLVDEVGQGRVDRHEPPPPVVEAHRLARQVEAWHREWFTLVPDEQAPDD